MLLFVTAYGQEMLSDGDMEKGDGWTVISNGTIAETVEFGYTTDTPSEGKDGCLHIASSVQSNTLIYQEVDVEAGKKYQVTGHLKLAL